MRIVADENIEKEIVDRLRADEHDVVFIAEAVPGIDDGRCWNKESIPTASC